jgi:hypothetical protein
MIKHRRELLRDVLIQQRSRHNVQNDELRERFRVIERQPMRRTAAPVMPHEREWLTSQMPHHFHLILRHGPLRVREMIPTSGRFAAISIAAQIRHHDKILLGQRRRDLAPEHMRLRNPMQ